LAAWVVAGAAAGYSALLGGGISTAASLVMVWLGLAGKRGADVQRAVGALYLGEVAKLAVVVVLFAIVLKTIKVVPLALFAAYVATFVVYWVALLNVRLFEGGGRNGQPLAGK
jgi:F0F1-type ATP synthase assembly protein I